MERLENAFRTPARVAGAFEFSSGTASEEEEEEESAFGDDANEVYAADANNTGSVQLVSLSSTPSSTRPSDGVVDWSFKFGGLPKFDAEKGTEMREEKEKAKFKGES